MSNTGILNRRGRIVRTGAGGGGGGRRLAVERGVRMVGGHRFLDTRGAAAALGVTPRRIIALIRDARLPAEKFGRDWLIDPKDLQRPEVQNRRPGRPRTEPSAAAEEEA